MFGMHTLVQTQRQWEHLSGPNKGNRTKVETSYHASTIEIDERHGVDFFADAVRSEWAIETGYHGKRDFAYCEDVRTRRCSENIIGAMMLARTPAFVFMAKRGITNSQAFKEELQVRGFRGRQAMARSHRVAAEAGCGRAEVRVRQAREAALLALHGAQ